MNVGRYAACVAALALASCAGGRAGSVVPRSIAPSGGAHAVASLVVHWTPTGPQAARRSPSQISASAASIVSSVNGTVVDVTNRNGSAQSTIDLDAPVGTDNFKFEIYDQTAGAGKLLGTALVSKAIVAGALNTIAATVEAVCAQTIATPVAGQGMVFYTMGPSGANGLFPPSIASAEILGTYSGEVQVAAADADGNVILAAGGTATITTGATARGVVIDANHVAFFGHKSVRNASALVNVAAPGCAMASFNVTTSSAIYRQLGPSVAVFDRFGNIFSGGAAPWGRLVGTTFTGPVFYDQTTGNVTFTNAELSNPVVAFIARAGAATVAFDAGRDALITVFPGASSTVYADSPSVAEKQVTVPMNVTVVSGGVPSAFVTAPSYYVADGTNVIAIDPVTFAAGSPVTASQHPFSGFCGSELYHQILTTNASAPFLSMYDATTFTPAFSQSLPFTAPITLGCAGDAEDTSLLGITAAGVIQQGTYAGGGATFTSPSMNGLPADAVAVLTPDQRF